MFAAKTYIIMKLFKDKSWKSFWPNFFAVFLGVIITFGGERLISDYMEKRSASEIVSKVKEDVRGKLEISNAWMNDWESRLACMKKVYTAYKDGQFEELPNDTVDMFVYIFFVKNVNVDNSSIRDLVTTSGCLKSINDPVIVDCVSTICAIMPLEWEYKQRAEIELSQIINRLRARMTYDMIGNPEKKNENSRKLARMLLEDNMCWTAIECGFFDYYVGLVRENQQLLRLLADRLEEEGY